MTASVLASDGDPAGQELEALLIDPRGRDDRPGQRGHRFVVRATGMNGESTPRSVTRLYPMTSRSATAVPARNDEYVDIAGFAVMRIATADSNIVNAYAITPVIADMNDPALRRGQVARLVPWD